jgi:hypothetical protein
MNVFHMIERLEDAIRVCYNAESNDDKGCPYDKGYPYATGYSQVTMQETIRELKEIMNEKDRG